MIERLLVSGPHIKVLATSRERLRINGESTWQVPPLGLPDNSADADFDAIMYADSVRLFIDRALAVRADQTLDHPAMCAIADIVDSRRRPAARY